MRPFTFSRQWPRGFLVEGTSIVAVDQASLSDRKEVEKLIAEYHASERITPIKERISWAVDQNLLGESPGLLLVAREKDMILGVALAVYTFRRTWTRDDCERFLRETRPPAEGSGKRTGQSHG